MHGRTNGRNQWTNGLWIASLLKRRWFKHFLIHFLLPFIHFLFRWYPSWAHISAKIYVGTFSIIFTTFPHFPSNMQHMHIYHHICNTCTFSIIFAIRVHFPSYSQFMYIFHHIPIWCTFSIIIPIHVHFPSYSHLMYIFHHICNKCTFSTIFAIHAHCPSYL